MRYNRYIPIGFAETKSQWQMLLSYRDRSCRDLQIVAVTPEVDCLALSGRQPSLCIEDFYYWDYINMLGQENMDIAEQACDEVDLVLREAIGRMPGFDLLSFRALFHPFKGFLDGITLRLAPVEAVFKYIQPSWVVCFPQSEYVIKGANLLDKPTLSLTSRIVPWVAQAQNCRVDWLSDAGINKDADTTSRNPQHGQVRDFNREKRFIEDQINILHEVLKRYQYKVQNPSGKPSLFSNEGLDHFTARILHCWQNHYGGAVFDITTLYTGRAGEDAKVIETSLNEIGQLLWSRIDQTQSIRQIFKTVGVDYYPLVSSFLNILITKEIPRLLFAAAIVQRNFSQLKNAVVMTGGMMDINSVIGKACSKYNVPMVSTHRGGFLGYCLTPFHERYELADADFYLCGGPGAAGTFAAPSPMARWRPERKRARPVVTGSAWVDELVTRYRTAKPCSAEQMTADQKLPKRKTIMYVMSALLGDNCYIGYIFHPEIWLWRFQYELINLLSRCPDIDVILKPPMSDRYPQITNPVFDWLKVQDFKNIRVYPEDTALEKIMDMADAFIVDSPSTPLWPLVSSEKPFAAYIDRTFFKLVPQAAVMLKKRAVFADNRDEFLEKLWAFLQKPDWTLEQPVNDEFLHHYGTYLNDGNSDKRVTEFLFQLAGGTCCRQSGESHEHYSTSSQCIGR
jgi:hypothetical protein